MNVNQLLNLHKETTDVCREIMERKNSDYCGGRTSTDALANFKTATALGLHPVTGLLLRMQDKLMRIKSFVNDGELRVTGETVEDACNDLVNYAILCKALLREAANKVEEEPAPAYENTDTGTDIDLSECQCGRRFIYHWLYGGLCEDCELKYQEPY
jgi:hypothetical protein